MACRTPRYLKWQPHSRHVLSVHVKPDLDFSVILLAAGQSKRMGRVNKLLLPANGEPLVRRAAKLYINLGLEVSVVLGHQADLVAAALSGLDVNIILNEDYAAGQQRSVEAGFNAISGATSKPVLIALSDQPFLTADDITEFCGAFLAGSSDKIMVPYWEQTRGNPVIFPAEIIQHMRAQDKLSAVRKFIDSNPDRVTRYDAPTHHFIRDVDTHEAAMRDLPQLN